MKRHFDRDIMMAQSSRRTNWIPPVPKRDSGIRWRLWHLIGVLLVAGPTILYLKIIWSNWKPFPRDNVPDVDYRGPQFFVAFFGGLCLAILIAVITSQLRPDIAGSLAAVSLCLAVPSLLWLGYQVVHEIAVSDFDRAVVLPRHLLDISFNAAASILGVALAAGSTIGLVVSLMRHDEI